MTNRKNATRAYGDSETTSFAKMGDEQLTDHLVNISGNRTPYTMPVARKGPKQDDDVNVGTKKNRSAAGPISAAEYNGPRCTPVATINYNSGQGSSETQRGMRTLPSKAGTGDFYMARTRDNAGRTID